MAPDGWSAWAAWLGLLGGALSGIGAWKAYRLAKAHDAVLQGDEEVLAGRLQKPDLQHLDHSKCVLWTHLVNRSHRRVAVSDVLAFGPRGEAIDIVWSGRIDSVGNPEGASGILSIGLDTELYLRRTDGESFSDGTVVKIAHGFRGSPLVVKYSSAGWADWVTS